jgi:hypothetical protein
MLEEQNLKKLENFFSEDLVEKALKSSIIKNELDTYILFDNYIISNNNTGYKLEFKKYHNYKTFYTLKNAFIFAMLDFKNKYFEVKRIEQIDKKIQSLDFKISNLRYKIRKNTNDNKLIYICKLSEDIAQKNSLLRELEKYENLAKSYYDKIYNLKG